MSVTNQDYQALKLLVRTRKDFQQQRIAIDNRLGRTKEGSDQDVDERSFKTDDFEYLVSLADSFKASEKDIEKHLKKMLKRFPVYNQFLSKVIGCGTVMAATIVSEIDIHKATTVSKIWQYSGLNPSNVRGKKRVDRKDGGFDLVTTDTMVRGDKRTPGFVAPFNGNLRTVLMGILADGIIKAQGHYALEFYYPYKKRLEQSEKLVEETKKGGKREKVMWKDASKGHRNDAAKRYMIKMFLKDLYAAWREIEGLEVRKPYQDGYLGHKHDE